MQRIGVWLGVAGLGLGLATSVWAGHGNWGYGPAGGPEEWHHISADYQVCGDGEFQSPIDIMPISTVPAEVKPAELHWTAFTPEIVNNGHTVQVNTKGQGGYAMLDGTRYDLLQFHFHHLSEHTVEGRHTPMEAHFVHKSNAGDLLVVGVLMVAGVENGVVGDVWGQIPEAGKSAEGLRAVDPNAMAPAGGPFFRYEGSLTTPPCSEIVTWTVLGEPITVSQSQIDAFARLYSNNYRPVQPLNRRYVLTSE